jgi:hypothetical protein
MNSCNDSFCFFSIFKLKVSFSFLVALAWLLSSRTFAFNILRNLGPASHEDISHVSGHYFLRLFRCRALVLTRSTILFSFFDFIDVIVTSVSVCVHDARKVTPSCFVRSLSFLSLCRASDHSIFSTDYVNFEDSCISCFHLHRSLSSCFL